MKDKVSKPENQYENLLSSISKTYLGGQQKAVTAVNAHLVETYWKIGQYIVEFEQKGKERAEYGTALLKEISKDMKLKHGKGFSLSNIKRMRQFYTVFPKGAELPHQLSWTHFVEILKISNALERGFYLQQTMNEKWSTTELIRQKKSSLYLRLAASKDKKGILELAHKGQTIQKPSDVIREPYTLDFLQIPEIHHYTERQLEDKIIEHLKDFLLELGKGFAFVGRQYRIPVGNRPHFVDLVFYHCILKCFVLIDLKREEAGYEDVGQMNMYLGYFENEENTEGDNPPIGMVLEKEKDDLLVQYAMHNISSQLFINKYQLYLPNKEELRNLIETQLHEKALIDNEGKDD
ncbi:MAG: PDDEXK nuclease domain-containing protein [Mariprofundaceae bacterium]|nr:PDDEXK nuclease domain-containing protein [Mariprofundaceae bacterium]